MCLSTSPSVRERPRANSCNLWIVVRPYMPENVWDETSKYGDLRGYQHDSGEGLYRRTLYTIWKRTAAPAKKC